jgi:hypothetical protein
MIPWKLIDYGQRHKPTPLAKMTPVYGPDATEKSAAASRNEEKIHESALDSESGHKMVSGEPWTTTVPAAAYRVDV